MHAIEQIEAAVESAIAASALVTTVTRWRAHSWDPAELPSADIVTPADTLRERTLDSQARTLQLDIALRAKAASGAVAVLRQKAAGIFDELKADPSLAALVADLYLVDQDTEIGQSDQDVAEMIMSFRVDYTLSVTDLTVITSGG